MTGGCADPGNHDCSEVLAEVYLLIDQECPKEHEAELRQHLNGCPGCLEEYGVSDQLKQLLARKCGGEHAPDQLKERLLASIRMTVEQRELTVEVRED